MFSVLCEVTELHLAKIANKTWSASEWQRQTGFTLLIREQCWSEAKCPEKCHSFICGFLAVQPCSLGIKSFSPTLFGLRQTEAYGVCRYEECNPGIVPLTRARVGHHISSFSSRRENVVCKSVIYLVAPLTADSSNMAARGLCSSRLAFIKTQHHFGSDPSQAFKLFQVRVRENSKPAHYCKVAKLEIVKTLAGAHDSLGGCGESSVALYGSCFSL